ncbi:class I SAM-dependent methyltransferase [Lacipirellula sp.]|uniref:class I SAM-dependent methyltransferase n=1 Tax=Lacipirellula sp. TaxID=2691419 RepID=UPI003D11F4FB
MIRHALFPVEAAVYGVSYAFLQNLIRSPQPLDPEKTWHAITREMPLGTDWIRTTWPIRPLRTLIIRAKMKQDHVLGISEHYDVSNDFYKLWLDRKYMFYTCADFHSPTDTIEEAQQHKADFILKLIDPQPGEKIMELGCGWGPMLKRISEATGERENLYGLTLSKEQKAYNDEHNHFNVDFDNFITRDYPSEAFDKIYSIGAWEHVRENEIPQLLDKLYAALKPGGRLVKHFFCRVSDYYTATVACSQIYFPGSMGAPYRFHAKAWEDAGFRIKHCSIHDYRPTLRAWFDRMVEHKEEALRLVDVQTYNRYLTFFPSSWRYFNDNLSMVTRWVLEKPAKGRSSSR